MFYKICLKLFTLKVYQCIFRPMWSSGVKIIGRGNCCLLLLFMLLIYKFPRCACVFGLLGCVLSCCVSCCVSCFRMHSKKCERILQYNIIRNLTLLWAEEKILAKALLRTIGRAIAQAFSRCLPTAAARVRVRDWSCGICGGQSGAGAGFLPVLLFPLPIFIPPVDPQSPSSIIWGWYNRPVAAAIPSGLSLTPLRIIKNNTAYNRN
jgi:hypothetical protein